jgi:hypothetical protein
VNGAIAGAGREGAAACLKLRFGPEVTHKLSYWNLALPQSVPIMEGITSISFHVRSNVDGTSAGGAPGKDGQAR